MKTRKDKMVTIKIEFPDGETQKFKVPMALAANILPVVAYRYSHGCEVSSPEVPSFDGTFDSVSNACGSVRTTGGCRYCGSEKTM
jgi:hypothetical protein